MQHRIGLMGGTFDPIHVGHLILAEQAWEQLGLEKVLFVTAADPPNKLGEVSTSAADRLEMTRLAVEGNGHFECSTIEIDRGGPSYTIDTIREILRLHGTDTLVYLLVGADEAGSLMTWRDPYGIQQLATVVVVNRPGYNMSDILEALPGDFAEKLVFLDMPGVDISSTDIRERVGFGRSIRYLVPDSVRDYIVSRGLY